MHAVRQSKWNQHVIDLCSSLHSRGYLIAVRTTFFWLANAIIALYPVAVSLNMIDEKDKATCFVVFVIAFIALGVVQLADRADRNDQKRFLSEGLRAVHYDLEVLVGAKAQDRLGDFKGLIRSVSNAITGLANPKYSQAQVFQVHECQDHDHFVSIYTTDGSKSKKSSNHFSSSGSARDQAVWESARKGETRFERDLGVFRPMKMPVGFSRWAKKKRYRTFITAPISVGDEVWGLLTINSKIPYSLSKSDVALVEACAMKMGIGLAAHGVLRKPPAYGTILNKTTKGCGP